MRQITKDSINQSVVIRIVDATDGTPEQAVEHDTAGISLWYRREGATITAIVPAALASLDAAHADGGIEHIDDGYYRLDVPDLAFATGVDGVMIGGFFTGMVVVGTYIELVDAKQTGDSYVRLGAPAGASVSADIVALKAETATIVADTNELQGDWVNGGRLDLILDARASQTSVDGVPTNAEFELRTLPSADYVVVGDTIAAVTTVGSVTGAVGSIAAGGIAVASFAAKAITAAAVDEEVRVLLANRNDHGGATAGITLNGAAGLTSTTGIIANVTGNLSGSVGSVGAGGIAAASFAAGAIDAAAIANGAIDAATFAADVDAEILSYIVDDATRIDATALNTAAVTTIPAIVEDTAVIGALGAGLTAVPWNAAWDAEVESEVTDALIALNLDHLMKTAVANNADMTAEVTDGTVLSNLMSATSDTSTFVINTDSLEGIAGAGGGGAPTVEQIRTEMDTNSTKLASILEDTGTTIPGTITTIDNEIAVIDGIVDDIKAVTVKLDTTLVVDGLVYDFTAEALAAAAGTGATAQQVWEYATRTLTAGVTVSGTLQTLDGLQGQILSYLQLMARKDAAIKFDLAADLALINADMGTGAGAYDNATDSIEALRDRGDAAWVTATSVTVSDKTGFSLAADQSAVTVGTVTTLTTLPAITANWLTAAGVAADAVTKIQAGLATPTNITAGTITTVTNLTNAPTVGDLTATMKASVNAEVDTALNTAIPVGPTADSINERVATMDGLILGTLAVGTHTAQTGDSFAYLGTNLGLLGASATALASAAALADGTIQVGTIRDNAIGAAVVADIFSTTAITEAYAADAAAGTVAQILYLIQQSLHEFAISATTRTVKKLDGATTAATFTLDDATTPTSTTRAT